MKTEVDFLSDFTLRLHILFIRIVKSESEKFRYKKYKECERDLAVALYRDNENKRMQDHLDTCTKCKCTRYCVHNCRIQYRGKEEVIASIIKESLNRDARVIYVTQDRSPVRRLG